MHSGLTGSSASPIHGGGTSPGSYLTVSGAVPEARGYPGLLSSPSYDPAATAASSSAAAAAAAGAGPSPSLLQPYYQLPEEQGQAWDGAVPEPAASAAHTDRLWLPGRLDQPHPPFSTTARPGFQPPLPAPPAGSPAGGHTRVVSPAIHVMQSATATPAGGLATGTPKRAVTSRGPSTSQLLAQRSPPSPGSTVDYAEIEQKQAELRGAVEYRIAHLESSLAAREDEVASLRGQLRRMEEDYQFNYNLIGERDAALEEASAQLQRLYRELKRVSTESSLMEKKLHAAEEDASALRQRALDADAAREKRLKQVERDFLDREKQLLDKLEEREAAMKSERDELHDRYMALTRDVEKSRESVLDQHTTLSHESSHRQQQQYEQLHEELTAVRRAHDALEAEKRGLEAALAAADVRVRALESEKVLLTQHAQATAEDAEGTRAVLARQLAESVEASGRTTGAVEDALRDQTRRVSALELEKAQLHRRLTDLEARLQHTAAAREEDRQRDAEQMDALRTSDRETRQALRAAADAHRLAEQTLQGELKACTQALDRSESKLRDALATSEAQAETLAHAREEAARQAQEVARLTADVARWKEAEDRATEKARQASIAHEARVLELERAARDTKDALDRQVTRSQDLQTRHQSEVARLTRELHASEAARRALEDQFHLSHDQNAQAAVLQGLRLEKEALQTRVMELERTNGEIQAQITNFTLELQNDPLVRSARETQQRLVGTQQDLLACKEENATLRGALAAKEEEAGRYQLALMRQTFVLNGEADLDDQVRAAPHATRTTSTRVWQQQQEASFATLRDTCTELRHALKREKHRRRRYQRRAKAVDGLTGAVLSSDDEEKGDERRRRAQSGASSSSRSSSCSSSRNRHVRGGGDGGHSSRSPARRQEATRRHRSATRDRGSRSASRGLAARPKEGEEGQQPHEQPQLQLQLQEAEVWRRKCLQLEQHVRTLLKERDQLLANLNTAQRAARAAEDEKRTLIDINAHLKSQLRDAYRTAFETQQAHVPQASAPQHARGSSAVPEVAASAAAPDAVSPEVYAAVLALLEREQQQRMASRSSGRAVSPSAVEAVAASFDSHSRPSPSPSMGAPQGLNLSPERAPATTSLAPGYGHEHGEDRLSLLEEEIRHVKAQISATQESHRRGHTALPTTTATERRARESSTVPAGGGAPVVRRGGAAVRHYGHA